MPSNALKNPTAKLQKEKRQLDETDRPKTIGAEVATKPRSVREPRRRMAKRKHVGDALDTKMPHEQKFIHC